MVDGGYMMIKRWNLTDDTQIQFGPFIYENFEPFLQMQS